MMIDIGVSKPSASSMPPMGRVKALGGRAPGGAPSASSASPATPQEESQEGEVTCPGCGCQLRLSAAPVTEETAEGEMGGEQSGAY